MEVAPCFLRPSYPSWLGLNSCLQTAEWVPATVLVPVKALERLKGPVQVHSGATEPATEVEPGQTDEKLTIAARVMPNRRATD